MQINEVYLFNQNIKELVGSIDFESFTHILVLVDENTKSDCYPLISDYLPAHELMIIKSGEIEKNLETCQLIWQKMTDLAFDRKALMVNLGGGVIGDMGGFCAAAYKRGIKFINIPTTLLAQVDASVGGKTGIDFNGFKNHLGFFQIPEKVLIDPIFLKTLPFNELRSGYAEVIKHCLIQDEDAFNTLLSKDFKNLDWFDWIFHSVKIKDKVVAEDPRESGWRKILNFGHTIGHAIETFFLERKGERLLHGEAIAVGMICETYLSVKQLGLSENKAKAIYQYILSIYQSKNWSNDFDQEILSHTKQDKKNEGGRVEAVLLEDIGKPKVACVISEEDILESLQFFKKLVSEEQ